MLSSKTCEYDYNNKGDVINDHWDFFFPGDLIMKYFLRSFSPFRCFKKGSCQFLAKECAQCWLTP